VVCIVRGKIELAIAACITGVSWYMYPIPELRRLTMKMIQVCEVNVKVQKQIQIVGCSTLCGFDGSKNNFLWTLLDTHGFVEFPDCLIARGDFVCQIISNITRNRNGLCLVSVKQISANLLSRDRVRSPILSPASPSTANASYHRLFRSLVLIRDDSLVRSA
jgi:hypothetical protein